MNIEERLSYFTGQLDTLRYLCCSLAVLHPQSHILIQLIKGNLKKAEEISSDTYYINGIKKIVEELEALLYLAVSAQQSALKKPEKDN